MAGPIWSFNKKDPKGSKKNPFTNEGVSISSGFGNPSTPKLATDLGKLHGVDDSWENILDEDSLRYNQLKALASVTEKDLKSNTGKSYTLADITGNSADKNVSFKKSAMPSGGQGEGKLELNIEGFKSLTPDDWRESLDDDNPEKKKSTEFMIAQAMITGKGKDKPGELKDRPRTEGEPEVKPEDIPEVAPRGQEEWDNIVSFIDRAGVVALALNITMMAVGYYVAKFFASGIAQRRCISLECGLQNGTLAVFVSTQIFDEMVYMVPTAAYALIMFITSIIFVIIVRKNT